MKLGFTYPKIKEHFNYLFENKKKEQVGTKDVPIGGSIKWIDVFEVDLDLPRYRLDNTRTIHLQKRYIAQNNLPQDFFSKDVWLDKLQQVQHEILRSLIIRKGLLDYFKSNEQTDPLILTHDGFVISGNRRLCAFRELFYNSEKDKPKYKHFERIRVAILPKLKDEEIEYIEDNLEQQPEIKDEFSWVARAIGFRGRLEKHHYDTKTLSDKSNFKEALIKSLLQQLSIAEDYLKDIEKPFEYDLIEKDKYAFEKIEKGRSDIKTGAKKDLFQKLSFLALRNQDKITDRMYDNIPYIQEKLNEIENEINEEFETEINKIKETTKNQNPLNDPSSTNNNTIPTIEFLNNSKHQDEIFEILLSKIDEAKGEKEESRRKVAVLKRIREAYGKLVEANNIRNNESDKEGVLKQLENIEKVIIELKNWAST